MKKLKFILLTAATVLFASVAIAQTMDELVKEFESGMTVIKEKKFYDGAKHFEKVIQMGPAVGEAADENVANAKKNLINCYIFAGRNNASANVKNYDQAIKDFEKAQQLANQYGELALRNQSGQLLSNVYYISGGTAYNAKDYAKAIDIFSKGYKAFPNNTQLALLLADSYDKQGNYDQADKVYKGIMALTHSRYAKDVEKAKADYAKSLLARASKAAESNNLGNVTKYTEEVLKVDPNNATALVLPIQVANNAKNYSEVIKRAPGAAAKISDPTQKSNVYFFLGAAYQNTDNFDKAIEAYKKVTAGNFAATAKAAIAELNN